MYTLPICLLVVGILFLITHIRFFLIQYKNEDTNQLSGILHYVNYVGLISSVSVIVLSTFYLFNLNQQL